MGLLTAPQAMIRPKWLKFCKYSLVVSSAAYGYQKMALDTRWMALPATDLQSRIERLTTDVVPVDVELVLLEDLLRGRRLVCGDSPGQDGDFRVPTTFLKLDTHS